MAPIPKNNVASSANHTRTTPLARSRWRKGAILTVMVYRPHLIDAVAWMVRMLSGTKGMLKSKF